MFYFLSKRKDIIVKLFILFHSQSGKENHLFVVNTNQIDHTPFSFFINFLKDVFYFEVNRSKFFYFGNNKK